MKTNITSCPPSAATYGHRRFMVLLSVLAAQCLGFNARAQSVTGAVPGYISYQGKVLDASGALVGAGTPVNRTVTFRVWDHASSTAAGDMLYSEQQTVSIAEGEFSVLVGQGVSTSGSPLSFDETSKGPPLTKIGDAGVFAGASRYLGVSVDDGSGGAPSEISPRQQIVSSAFALRAKVAESLGTTGTALTALDSGNVGVGTANPPALFTVTGANVGTSSSTPQLLVTDSVDSSKRLRIGEDSTGTGSGFLQSYKEGVGAQNLLLNPQGGNVGIGTATPGYQLSLGSTFANTKLAIYESGSNVFGLGAQSGQFRLNLSSATDRFSFLNAPAGTETMSILGNGNVGIGVTAPGTGNRLDVRGGNMYLDGVYTGTIGLAYTTTSTVHVRDQKLVMAAYNLNGTEQYSWLQSSNDAGVTYPIILNPNGGNIGIGSAVAPGCSLQVNGGIRARGGPPGIGGGNNNGFAFSGNGGDTDSGMFSDADGALELYTNGAETMRVVGSTQAVGIGTTTPTQAKLVVSGTQNNSTGNFYFLNSGGTGTGGAAINPYSIWATGRVGAGEFNAFSDERIKNIRGPSDAAVDLATLMQISVTDYTYRDTLEKGAGVQKKVIAQQVEKVYPQAVSKVTNVVPDIYKKAGIEDGWVTLTTDVKVGERVRLIADKEDQVTEVLEIDEKHHTKFRTDFNPEGDKVFVYGHEVKDFRTVDYDAISMLNISATQQIKKEKDAEVKALQDENAGLRKQLADIEAKNKASDSRLAAIEKLLESAAKPGARTVSMKRSEGAE